MLVESGEGANISSLNQKALSTLPVVLPTPERQLEIIEQIDVIYRERERLLTVYQQKLTALNELKQSLLQKAFAGELTSAPGSDVKQAAA